jgi:hypothetical protein
VWKWGGVRGRGWGDKREKMTQTMYAHVNKWINKLFSGAGMETWALYILTEHSSHWDATIALMFFYFNLFILDCCAGWLHIVAFTNVLAIYQIYHVWTHLLHHSPLFLPPSISVIASTGIIFSFTYLCMQYLHYIHPPTNFLHLFPLSTGTNLSRQDLFCPAVLKLCKKKKKAFLFV